MTETTVSIAADGFRPLGVVDEPVEHVDRAVARSGYRVYRGRGGFEVAIPECLVERLLAMGRRAAPHEWCGLLVGRLYKDAIGSHVVLAGVVPDPDAEAGSAFVKTSHESEFHTRNGARLLFPDAVVLGWTHGHLHYGARFSTTDFKAQSAWSRDHSIGIVADPWCNPTLGVYRGPEAELLDLVRQEAPTPALPNVTVDDTKAKPRRRRLAAVLGAVKRKVRPSKVAVLLLALVVCGVAARGAAAFVRRLDRLEHRVLAVEQRPPAVAGPVPPVAPVPDAAADAVEGGAQTGYGR